jgi:hypothetical protein
MNGIFNETTIVLANNLFMQRCMGKSLTKDENLFLNSFMTAMHMHNLVLEEHLRNQYDEIRQKQN